MKKLLGLISAATICVTLAGCDSLGFVPVQTTHTSSTTVTSSSSTSSSSPAITHTYQVVFSGGELGAKPDICTKIISPGAAPVVTCTGSVPENLIQKIRESDQTHLEVPSDGNGNYTFTATQIN